MQVKKSNDEDVHKCLVCGYEMVKMQACHIKCVNCGAEMDCSDKGFIW